MSEFSLDKRVAVVCGHFGSGKTEFSVNYALKLAAEGKKTALVDLDIANPYFRSRERQQLLEENGVRLYSNIYRLDISADLPAITAEIRAPLEDKSCHVVVDAGGDETGARILTQFRKYFKEDDCGMYCVVNANRPETGTFAGALEHVRRIQEETGLLFSGLINNTHMLTETVPEDITKGYALCRELAGFLGISVKCTCVTAVQYDNIAKLTDSVGAGALFPITLYMRPTWLDR